MSSQIEQIKERIDIADLISTYIELHHSGAYYKTTCPFHNEKSPSFFVSPSRGTYHCFGCGVHGDIFSFVQEIEGVSFYEALKTLADKAGVVLQKTYDSQKEESDEIKQVLELATLFYEFCLTKKPEALEYLKNRGLSQETIKDFRIGYSPLSGGRLIEFLKKKGVKESIMIDAGLVSKGDNGLYERFRGRIIFPIGNQSGKIIGFSGRILVDKKDRSGNPLAKYINSPETKVYDKKSVLYGYDKAKIDILRKKRVIVVEGQMDLVMSHQVKILETVAVSGTALTKEHIAILKRSAEEIIFCFDGDNAGVNASRKSYQLAVSGGLEVSLVSLPKGKDPADIIKENKEDWIKTLENKKNIVEFLLEYVGQSHKEKKDKIKAVSSVILPIVKSINSSIEKSFYTQKIADFLDVDELSVKEELEKVEGIKFDTEKEQDQSTQNKIDKNKISLLLGAVYKIGMTENQAILEKLEKGLEGLVDKDMLLQRFENMSPPDKEAYLFRASIFLNDNENFQINKIARATKMEILEDQIQEKHVKLRETERKKDEESIKSLMSEINKLNKELEELKLSK